MDEFSWRDELFANIARHIETMGWSLVHVGGGGCVVPGCDGAHESDLDGIGLPPYGYTVGLPLRFDHPEVVVVGLANPEASHILNAIGAAIAGGARLAAGDLLEIDGVAMKIGSCAVSIVRDGLVAISIDYHFSIGHPSLPPLQVMWPDDDGRFPGDPRFDRRLRRLQPLLARRLPRDRARR